MRSHVSLLPSAILRARRPAILHVTIDKGLSMQRPMPRAVHLLHNLAALGLLAASTVAPAHQNGPGYIVLGDSIEVGVGASLPGNAYVEQFSQFLKTDLHNLAASAATARDITQTQLAPAKAELVSHTPRVASWGGGGNDLLNFILSPQSRTCSKGNPSCLARVNALLNEIEQTVDRTLREVRQAAGPSAPIYVRTQYNPLQSSCASAPPFLAGPNSPLAALADIALEATPAHGLTLLQRGLNTRLRELAAKYGARVIDTYLPFRLAPDALIGDDCVHPNDLGHATIFELAKMATGL